MLKEYSRAGEFLKISRILQSNGYKFVWNNSFNYTLNIIVKLNSEKRINTQIEIIKEILTQNNYKIDKIFNKNNEIIINNLVEVK